MTKDDFAALHLSGEPLVLFNIWDAASAQAVENAGAKAIATGSLALAGAQGFQDGEAIGFDALLHTVRQISNAIGDCPLTVDIESGFADGLAELEANCAALVAAGAVGRNLEDQLIGQEAVRDASEQAERISVAASTGLFVNARTDLFLKPLMAGEDPNRADLVEQAIERAETYHTAGAGSFFVPGLNHPDLIKQLCDSAEIAINVMRLPDMVSNAELAKLGVARISYGPGPWREAMAGVEAAARAAFTA